MRFRPEKGWRFTLYTPRSETVRALAALARSTTIQLDAQPNTNTTLEIRRLQPIIARYQILLHNCGKLLPHYEICPLPPRGALDDLANTALTYLTEWCAQMQALITHQTHLQQQRDQLDLLDEFLTHTAASQNDLTRFGTHSQLLYKGLFACPPTQAPQRSFRHALEVITRGPMHNFYLYLGLPEQRDFIEQTITPACKPLAIPSWLHNSDEDWRTQVQQRLVIVDTDIQQNKKAQQVLRDESGVTEALGELSLLRWYLRQARNLSQNDRFSYITGWTMSPAEVYAVIQQANIKAIVRFPRTISTNGSPVRLRSSTWLAPFDLFMRLYGTPNENEIDPRPILAIIVPLLFGYMFPDVGHGFILASVGALLYQRWPDGRFLLPCGLSAVVFGVVFGEVFGYENLITPLWTHPLDEPLWVLIVPMLFGVILILLGIVLSGVQAHWRGAGRRWLMADAAVLPLYLGSLATAVWPEAAVIPIIALIWFISGAVLRDLRTPWHALQTAFAQLLESSFQLLINTISFARVGAFALAHAGLSKALLLLGENIDNPAVLVIYLVISQTLIISLEALIVFVQTVRLIFLEFFMRFLRAEGHQLEPLQPPHP